ncbi:putative spermidine/putrescine transport system ATP-binding protein [Deinococcus metalli]|uniref:ABC transporter ATP-binding protein n=1 Tax=Deinococcus metalli TaxID=1141878 RepID=A0A7W8NN93_9DEIO|nr:ABC transporter ATP-binding protein [Deinococcus metalli]MBB5376654.1 putative spermidine/putrescine transport system ATP-binding protein [Deinococcus metalli]GHF42475.1 ABC transporter ATP-binding protein [Deinococcus metalli]
MSEIDFDHVSKVYAGRPAVSALNLSIHSGELVCLLGPSGCGKTTTLRLLAGFLTPDAGDVRIAGHSVVRLGPEARPTAMVFQRYTLWPHMNVFHNVAFGLKLRRLPPAQIVQKVQRALELVGLPGMERRSPAQLSGGQQQRVALARALVLEPQVLLLDEPLSSLDARLRVTLRDEIRAIQRNLGITTVFVTHDQEEALAVSDRIAVMDQGVLQQLDDPGTLYARPATRFVAEFIGRMNFLPASAGPLLGLDVPDGAELAVRPEDLHFGAVGAPFRAEHVLDLGPVREVRGRLTLPGAAGEVPLTVQLARGEAPDMTAVRVRRALTYRDGALLGDAAPVMGVGA